MVSIDVLTCAQSRQPCIRTFIFCFLLYAFEAASLFRTVKREVIITVDFKILNIEVFLQFCGCKFAFTKVVYLNLGVLCYYY